MLCLCLRLCAGERALLTVSAYPQLCRRTSRSYLSLRVTLQHWNRRSALTLLYMLLLLPLRLCTVHGVLVCVAVIFSFPFKILNSQPLSNHWHWTDMSQKHNVLAPPKISSFREPNRFALRRPSGQGETWWFDENVQPSCTAARQTLIANISVHGNQFTTIFCERKYAKLFYCVNRHFWMSHEMPKKNCIILSN